MSTTRRALIGGGVVAACAGAAGVGVLASRDGGAIVAGHGRARRIASDPRPPRAADVVVVGGGNVGSFAAMYLAERGLKVVLCEKGVVAGEASGRSLGYVDGQMLDPVKMPIIGRSKELWAGLAGRLGRDVGYRRAGLALLLESEESAAAAAGWLEAVKGGPMVDARIVGAKAAAALAPGSSTPFRAAMVQSSDGYAEPQLVASGVAEHVRRLGGSVVENCAVRAIERAGGKITGVVTEKGSIACAAVVLAGGLWSPLLAGTLDVELPQIMSFGSCARLAPCAGPDQSLLFADRTLVMRRSIGGGFDICRGIGITPITAGLIGMAPRLGQAYRNFGDSIVPVLNFRTFLSQLTIPSRWAADAVSPFEKNRIFTPEVSSYSVNGARRDLDDYLPAFRGVRTVERWAGALTTTPDNMPVISTVRGVAGLVIGAGFYYGLTMAPAAGEAIADLVTGRRPALDLSLFQLDRFTSGAGLTFRH